MKRAFTMVEIIVVIVIMGILSAGTLVSIKHLYTRAAKSGKINAFSVTSDVALNQISSMLYDRVPSTVIGYNSTTGNFESIYDIDTGFTILEWIGYAKEALNARQYSGFIDMNGSDRGNIVLRSDTNSSDLNTTEYHKFGISYNYANPNNANVTALIFAGSFDSGASTSDFNSSFGWHGNDHNLTYDITNMNDTIITLATRPNEIYAKYYLVDSAYAVARGADINRTSTCITDLNVSNNDINDTLFLFYNYRPWRGETFCADIDDNNGTREGNVTILAQHVTAFRTGIINDSIYFDMTMSQQIRGTENNVTVSKQKVVF